MTNELVLNEREREREFDGQCWYWELRHKWISISEMQAHNIHSVNYADDELICHKWGSDYLQRSLQNREPLSDVLAFSAAPL